MEQLASDPGKGPAAPFGLNFPPRQMMFKTSGRSPADAILLTVLNKWKKPRSAHERFQLHNFAGRRRGDRCAPDEAGLQTEQYSQSRPVGERWIGSRCLFERP